MFKKNDRVTLRDAWGQPGTIIKVAKNEIRVQWDDGFETPVHPEQIEHEKDGSILRQESATASEINTQKKDDSMTQSIDYNGHMPTPPAGFRPYTVQDTINGEPYGETWTEYLGPEAHQGAVSIESSWSPDNGIIHFVSNQSQSDNGIFTTEELIELGRMIREVVAATKLSTAENAGIKICTTCNEGKLLSEFSKHVSNRDGLQSHCKDCAAEYYAKGKGGDNA